MEHEKRSKNTSIHLYTFLEMIDAVLELRKSKNGWITKIEYCDVKDGCMLRGEYGVGNSPDEAILCYLNNIKSKRIVLYAGSSEYRREYVVPENIYFDEV